MISHHNVIANVMQYYLHEEVGRKAAGVTTSVILGLLPFSHIYALVLVLHGAGWRGDEVIVLPKFDFKTFLGSIQKYKINQLLVVCWLVQTTFGGVVSQDLSRCHRSSSGCSATRKSRGNTTSAV